MPGARVLRIHRAGPDCLGYLQRQRAFYARLRGQLPYATPRVLEIGQQGGAVFSIEERIDGADLASCLHRLRGPARARALEGFVAAIAPLAGVDVAGQPYGEVLAEHPRQAATWPGFLAMVIDDSLARSAAVLPQEVGCGPEPLRDRLMALAAALPPSPRKALVHGDYWPSNVMAGARQQVTGLLDFGHMVVVGDPLMDAAATALWLDLVPACTPADRACVQAALARRYGPGLGPATTFYRAYFSLYYLHWCDHPPWRRWYAANLRCLIQGRDAQGAEAWPDSPTSSSKSDRRSNTS